MGSDTLDFSRSFYEALYEDEKYRNFLGQFITPSEKAKKKAQVSSIAGGFVGKLVGVGWYSRTGVAVTFNKHPIDIMTFIGHKDYWKTRVNFYFQIKGLLLKNLFLRARAWDHSERMAIEPVKKGIMRREVVSVKLRFDFPGKERIENDKELIHNLFELFKSKKMHEVSGFALVTVQLKAVKQFMMVKIEACIENDANKETMKILFDSAAKIAQHVQTTLERR